MSASPIYSTLLETQTATATYLCNKQNLPTTTRATKKSKWGSTTTSPRSRKPNSESLSKTTPASHPPPRTLRCRPATQQTQPTLRESARSARRESSACAIVLRSSAKKMRGDSMNGKRALNFAINHTTILPNLRHLHNPPRRNPSQSDQ